MGFIRLSLVVFLVIVLLRVWSWGLVIVRLVCIMVILLMMRIGCVSRWWVCLVVLLFVFVLMSGLVLMVFRLVCVFVCWFVIIICWGVRDWLCLLVMKVFICLIVCVGGSGVVMSGCVILLG